MNRYSRYRTFYYASMVKFCSNEKLKRVRVSRIYSLKYLFRSTLLWYITSFVFLRRETSFTAENFRLKNWFCPQSFVLPMRFSVVLLPMGFSVVLPMRFSVLSYLWGSLLSYLWGSLLSYLWGFLLSWGTCRGSPAWRCGCWARRSGPYQTACLSGCWTEPPPD